MTDNSKERFLNSILEPKIILLPSTNGTLHKPSTHTNTFRVRFELPNNETVLPTNTNYSTLNENPRSACTDNIKGKLLLHPHTDLLFIINRVYIINNKPLVRLYYCTRNGVPTTYIIPPLLSFATTCRLLKLYEEHARFTHKNPVYSPHTSPRQKEYNSSYTVNHHSLNTRLINEYFTGNPAIGYALGMKTDTISTSVPKTYRQAMKSAESAEWQEAINAELQSMLTNDVWKPAILPLGRKLVTTKWVFQPKHDIHRKMTKYKARLVARGFEHIYGKNFDETDSPVTCLSSLKLQFAHLCSSL